MFFVLPYPDLFKYSGIGISLRSIRRMSLCRTGMSWCRTGIPITSGQTCLPAGRESRKFHPSPHPEVSGPTPARAKFSSHIINDFNGIRQSLISPCALIPIASGFWNSCTALLQILYLLLSTTFFLAPDCVMVFPFRPACPAGRG